jgi:HPt (histidine-containing phosphotransfer) domain-containing protein
MSNASEKVSDDVASKQYAESSPPKVMNMEELINRCMGNIDLVQRVLEKFGQRLPEDLEELERALEAGNTEEVARVAHRLKGSSASVSAEGIASAASRIEEAGRAGRSAEIPMALDRLRSEWKRYLDRPMTSMGMESGGQNSKTATHKNSAATPETRSCAF